MSDSEPISDTAAPAAAPPPRDPRWTWPAVLVIAALAGVAYGWAADSVSIELFYGGAVRTMSHDWHAFLFGGFDPSGTFTLDKSPGAFWIQALVVRVFGISTVALVAPQIAAGVLSVIAMFRAVRRIAGERAGLVAAAIVAATPATAVMSRGNTADPICVLLLILAADATVRAVTDGRPRTLILAAGYVGLAFQVKMIEAWAILPALALAYLIAAPGSKRRRFAVVGTAGAVTLAVSLSWMTAVTLVPASQRPYVDGSAHNSVFDQVFTYNGLARFGSDPGYGLGADPAYRPSAQALAYTRDQAEAFRVQADQSAPGWTRLVSGPVGRDAGWLLPAALAVLLAGLVARRRRPRTDLVRAGLVVWGGWLVVFTVAFSKASDLLTYYTGMLVPATAALCAIGLRLAYRALRVRPAAPRAAAATTAVVIAGTVAVEALLTRDTPGWLWGLTIGAGVAGLALFLVTLVVRPGLRSPGVAVAAAALLVAPVVTLAAFIADGGASFDAPYTALGTLAHPTPVKEPGPSLPGYGGVVMPVMGDDEWRVFAADRNFWSTRLGPGQQVLVFTSAQASITVMEGVSGVVPIGGFTGLIGVPTADQVRTMITSGRAALAVVPGPGDLRANDPRVLLIESICRRELVLGGTDIARTAAPQLYACPGAATG